MVALIVAAWILLVTVRLFNVPTVVINGWLPLVIVELIVPDWILPVTVKALKLPRLVILFNVPGASVPLNVPPTIVPGTVKLLAVMVPDTDKVPRVPTFVIFG